MNDNTILRKQNIALILVSITIIYNLIEEIVFTMFGDSDETLALFGFGVDSFVEVLSGIGIAHMIVRMKRHPIESRDEFEVTALQITGTAFYLLVVGLIIGTELSFIYQSNPDTTIVGIIISSISILTMYILYRQKLKVRQAMNSEPIVLRCQLHQNLFLPFIHFTWF